MRPPRAAGVRLDRVRGVVLGVDDFDDELDRVDLRGLGPHERARLTARLRQVLLQLEGDMPEPGRLH